MENSSFLVPAAVWLAIFPLAHLVHFAEEYWCGGGYPAYLFRLRGVRLSTKRFLIFQTLFFVFFVAVGLISYQLDFPQFMITLLGGLFLCNGLSHTVTAIWDRRYGPGLVSSALLWVPLGISAIVAMFGQIPNTQFAIAAVVGFSINGAVALVTMRGGKLR